MSEAEKPPEPQRAGSQETVLQTVSSKKVEHTRGGVRFTLRTAFALTALAAAYSAYEARLVERSRYHRQMEKVIEGLGGDVSFGGSDGRQELHRGDILYHWNEWHYQSFLEHCDRYLDRITHIALNRDIGDREIAALDLSSLPTLEYLDLAYSDISDDTLLDIAKLPRLGSLVLDGTNITDAGLRHLSRMENLQQLFVSHTRITDDGFEELAGLPNLKVLAFHHTQVSLEGIRNFARARSASLPLCLRLSDTIISSSAIVALCTEEGATMSPMTFEVAHLREYNERYKF